jgi:hypothetical protein
MFARERSFVYKGAKLKRDIIFGVIVIVIGLFIAFGPQHIFKVCAHGDGAYALCHWSAQAEAGIGLLIAALGACVIVFADARTRLGLFIGIFLSGVVALAIPHFLIGGCNSASMRCRTTAFPALTVESVILLVFSAVILTITAMKKE